MRYEAKPEGQVCFWQTKGSKSSQGANSQVCCVCWTSLTTAGDQSVSVERIHSPCLTLGWSALQKPTYLLMKRPEADSSVLVDKLSIDRKPIQND